MDPSLRREMMRRQAAAMTIVMVSFVSTRLKRKSPEPDTEPDPLTLWIREQNELHRQRTLALIYNSTDVECISMLRMRRAPFFALCDLLRHRQLVTDREGVSVEEQVAMFLHVVGHNQRFRVVRHSFRRSIETVHKHFHVVLNAVGQLRTEDYLRGWLTIWALIYWTEQVIVTHYYQPLLAVVYFMHVFCLLCFVEIIVSVPMMSITLRLGFHLCHVMTNNCMRWLTNFSCVIHHI